MINLDTMIAAAKELRAVIGDVSIDTLGCTIYPDTVVFYLNPDTQERIILNMKTGEIVKHYNDTWRNPWHKTEIRKAK